jgi:hypothetical protein
MTASASALAWRRVHLLVKVCAGPCWLLRSAITDGLITRGGDYRLH